MKKTMLSLLALTLLSEAAVAQGLVAHPPFGTNGALNTEIAPGTDAIYRHHMGADGKLLLAGGGYFSGCNCNRISFMRIDTLCGALDPTFGPGGTISHVFDQRSWLRDMKVLPDGRILACGQNAPSNSLSQHVNAVYRFNVDGTADLTMNGTAWRTDRFDAVSSGIHCAVLPMLGDRFYAVGTSVNNINGGAVGLGVMRYLSDGSLDTGYSGDGKTWTPPPAPHTVAEGNTALLLPDSSVLWIGAVDGTPPNLLLHFARFLPTGQLDPAFGTGGQLTTTLNVVTNAAQNQRIHAELLPDGRYLIGAQSLDGRYLLARYMPDGSLDPTYGVAGISLADTSPGIDTPYGIHLFSDGSTVQFGGLNFTTGYHMVKRTADGALDNAFGANGIHPIPNILGDQTVHGGLMLGDNAAIAYGFGGALQNALVIKLTTNPSTGLFADLGPDIAGCTGETVVLDAGSPGSAYLWNGGSTQQSLSVTSSGTYQVSITNTLGCTDGDTIQVSFSAPPEPSISYLNNVLYTDGTANIQWYLDGTAILGATASEHPPLGNGTYTVSVTDANGCSTMSAPIVVLNTSVNDLPEGSGHVRVYPNPATGSIRIEGLPSEARQVQIRGSDGRLISSMRSIAGMPLSLIGSSPGTYLLITLDHTGQRLSTTPFVKH